MPRKLKPHGAVGLDPVGRRNSFKKGECSKMEKSKILIVDDDPDMRRALRKRLWANNYDTVQAHDGYSAIALAHKEHPDLIVLDLGLPVGDGFVVLDNLHNTDTLAHIPVVVLTARDPRDNRERAIKGGAVAFFQKPADNVELLDIIRASLIDSRASSGASA
jgi:two-component system KDP operon response regulator KdpE